MEIEQVPGQGLYIHSMVKRSGPNMEQERMGKGKEDYIQYLETYHLNLQEVKSLYLK